MPSLSMWDVSEAVFLVARSRDLIPQMMLSIIGQAFPPPKMATYGVTVEPGALRTSFPYADLVLHSENTSRVVRRVW